MEGLEILWRVQAIGSYPVRSHLTDLNDGPKTGVGSYPEQEASHHASLTEYGSLIDQGKWKPQQANKYGSRATCPITTSLSRIFMNKWAFDSKIIIKAIQTKESNN